MVNLNIFDPKPKPVIDNLSELRIALDSIIPRKILDKNLLIATWNIRCFGDLTKKWESEEKDSPKRDYHSLWCIAEIIRRFDVVAIQEVRSNLRGLRYLLKILGWHWSVIMTDVTKGKDGNYERLAFVFDTRKVRLSGLACELVIPPEKIGKPIETGGIGESAYTHQFARTPYAVAFKSKFKTFILVTLHVFYGQNKEDKERRKTELANIAAMLSDWSKEISQWGHNLICLGDFNIERRGDELYQAFTSTGLRVPRDLHHAPRTIFDKSDSNKSFYDQIAWFYNNPPLDLKSEPDPNTSHLSMKHCKSGYFNFRDITLIKRNLDNLAMSWRISDHFPLWTEFSVEPEFK